MKLTFLGGADEIGASSTIVELAGARFLVDCGLRHHERSGERLPALGGIEGKIDAIILTHAHLDHSGGLPVAAQSYPNIPIYLTAPTLSIVSILLMDAVKIMDLGLKADGELPIYGMAQIEQTISACRPVAFNSPIQIAPDVELTFKPAGHILGAATAILESSEGSIGLSGDIHATDQLTVPGLVNPASKPDIFVIESTYGGKQHVSRALEETRLIERVAQVVINKGSVLIPAFAVGRAQELILLMSRAIEQGKIPRTPIYVDGMVKSVCAAYSSFPQLMTPWLQHRIKSKGNPFFYERGPAVPIYDPKTRKEAAKVRPSIIISSSGMVSVGSPSSFYANEFASDPRCLIAISGYQDEESPGRQMLELARAGGGELPTATGGVKLQCSIEAFNFSAHSDCYQLLNEIQIVQPRRVVLVHGAGGAREALSKSLVEVGVKDVSLPSLGREIEIGGKKQKRSQIAFNGTGNVEEITSSAGAFVDRSPAGNSLDRVNLLDEESSYELAKRLLAEDNNTRTYTIPELLSRADYPSAAITTDEVNRVRQLLASKRSSFSNDRKQKSLWRLRVLPGGRVWTPGADLNQGELDKLVRGLFKPEDGLYKVGILRVERVIQLRFYFPKPIIERYQEKIDELSDTTGWLIKVNSEPHQEELMRTALVLIPVEWCAGATSVMHGNEKVQVIVEKMDEDEAKRIARTFFNKTGYQLEIRMPQAVTEFETSRLKLTTKAMEINTAFQVIRNAFTSLSHQPIRIGKKLDSIEITFISPEIGARYGDVLERLSRETGYQLTIRPSPDQIELQKKAKQLIPGEWQLLGEPGLNLVRREVVVRVRSKLAQGYLAEDLTNLYFDATGWRLILESSKGFG